MLHTDHNVQPQTLAEIVSKCRYNNKSTVFAIQLSAKKAINVFPHFYVMETMHSVFSEAFIKTRGLGHLVTNHDD